jgi:glycosyltransferase involved in cell wall biosynthesis
MGIPTDVMTFHMNKKWNSLWNGKIAKVDNFKVFKIPGLNWFPIEHSQRFTFRINLIPGRFAHKLKLYDIIHFHDDSDLTFPLFSYFVKKPKLFHLHGFTVDFYKRNFIGRQIFKNVTDKYISLSKDVEENLIRLGISKEKIIRLPNGIDVNTYYPSGKKEGNLVLYVGRITKTKGVHILLESLRYLKQPIDLVLIGPPDWGFEEISKLIMKAKGMHNVRYLGILKTEEVIRWYQKASIFVHPSFMEIFPMTDLEALACGTPVVATPVGGIPEIVCDGKNGISVPVGDPVRLAEAIQYLLENKNIRIKYGEEGRKWVVKCFSLEAVTKRLCGIYEEILR